MPLWSADNHLHSKCRFSGVGRMSGNTCPDKCCGPGICRTMCLSRHTASVACLADRMPDGAYAGRHVSDSTQRDALAPGTAPAVRDTDRAASRQRTLMQSQNPRYGMQAASRACVGHVPEHPADIRVSLPHSHRHRTCLGGNAFVRVVRASFPRAQDVCRIDKPGPDAYD